MTSRVAKNPIQLPSGVDVNIANQVVTVKGKHGELKQVFPAVISVTSHEGSVQVKAANDEKQTIALSGTFRALIQNMVKGVSEGFVKKLVLVGVGYRAKVQGNDLDLTLGFSHPLVMKMPKGITVETPSNTEVIIKGADRQLVGQIAADIRAKRPPEPYKGKGIRDADEKVILKEGKKKE